MDKWGKLAETMLAQIPEKEQDEAKPVLAFFAELGREVEDVRQNLDRIATALEKRA